MMIVKLWLSRNTVSTF